MMDKEIKKDKNILLFAESVKNFENNNKFKNSSIDQSVFILKEKVHTPWIERLQYEQLF